MYTQHSRKYGCARKLLRAFVLSSIRFFILHHFAVYIRPAGVCIWCLVASGDHARYSRAIWRFSIFRFYTNGVSDLRNIMRVLSCPQPASVVSQTDRQTDRAAVVVVHIHTAPQTPDAIAMQFPIILETIIPHAETPAFSRI